MKIKSNVLKFKNQIVEIKQFVRSVGIPINILGYIYIVDALKHMLSFKKAVFLNDIYNIIAKEHNTSAQCIEVAIRNAIKKACNNPTDEFTALFDFCGLKPSNSVFLMSLKEEVLNKIECDTQIN